MMKLFHVRTKMGQTLIVLLAAHSLLAMAQAVNAMDTNSAVASRSGDVLVEAEPLDTVVGQVKSVDAAYEAYSRASKADEKQRLWKAYTQTNDTVISKIPATVRRNATSPTSFELLEWTVTNRRISALPLRHFDLEAIELLREHWSTHPNLGNVCRSLGVMGDASHKPTTEFLQLASVRNPDRATRGYATFTLAHLMKEKAHNLAVLEIAPWIATNGPAQKEKTAEPDAKTVFHEAELLFEKVVKEYGDCPDFPAGLGVSEPKTTLEEHATPELDECRHLIPGSPAPEIVGRDLEGRELKLSSYRGKVVLLSFWASWCGPCMQMVPHERAMAERFKGRPFSLIGVNGDENILDAQHAATKENIAWRSFWNGAGGPEGGIAADWNVHGWPMVYVIDTKGVIRLRVSGYGGRWTETLLDSVTERLLEEGA